MSRRARRPCDGSWDACDPRKGARFQEVRPGSALAPTTLISVATIKVPVTATVFLVKVMSYDSVASGVIEGFL
jgi:hypothetical protein